MNYNPLVIEHFFNPRHTVLKDAAHPFVTKASIGSLRQGDIVELSLVCDQSGIIIDLAFKAYGNPFLIAALSWFCEQSKGEDLALVCQNLTRQDLFNALEIPTSRVYSVFIIEDVFNKLAQLIEQSKRGSDES